MINHLRLINKNIKNYTIKFIIFALLLCTILPLVLFICNPDKCANVVYYSLVFVNTLWINTLIVAYIIIKYIDRVKCIIENENNINGAVLNV